MPRLRVLVLIALLPAVAFAAIARGPYLLNPGKETMTVSWVTDDPAPGVVRYAASGDPVEVPSLPEKFERAGLRTEYHHHVPLYGLTADTVYAYTVESGGEQAGPFEFVTAPPNTEPFSFAVYGDTRGGHGDALDPEHLSLVEAIRPWAPALLVNTGDLIGSGEDVLDWDAYFAELADLGAETALVPAYGNHESGYDAEHDLSGKDNWARYFPLPGAGRQDQWYSLDYGNVHLVVINMTDVQTLLTEDAAQRVWLREDLAAAAANPRVNLIMAFYHQPAFSWDEGRNADFTALAVVDPMLRDAGAKLVWSGHNHHYARALFNGMEHVTTGGGGASLYEFVADVEDEPGYRAHALAYHFCLVDVTPMSAHVTVYGVAGDVLDEFEVTADRPVTPEDDDTGDDDTGGDDTAADDDTSGDDDAGGDDSGSTDDDGGADDAGDDDDGGCCGA
jgi:hypothetical protein